MRAPGRQSTTPIALLALLCTLALAARPDPVQAQYMFLDTNEDGVNDESDRIDLSGATTVDLWLDTAHNRDGSPTSCNTDPETPLTINSWEVVLRAVGGTIEWGPLENRLPMPSGPIGFATEADTTDPDWYHNGWGSLDRHEPGRYHLGRMRIRVLSGDPAIVFRPSNPAQPTDLTSFGTLCAGPEMDNTYRFGSDWLDAAGLGYGRLVGNPGGPYLGDLDVPLTLASPEVLSPSGLPVTYFWDFGDGSTGSGQSVRHTYTALGEYHVTLTVQDGVTTHVSWTSASILDRVSPVARITAPSTGYVGVGLFLDGRGSTDENGDPLTYRWVFGDGTWAPGSYVSKVYFAAGTYTVTLTVSDGLFEDDDQTQIRIDGRLQTPPVPEAGGPYTGYRGVFLRFDGTRSYDPEGDLLRYRWIFGDGQEDTNVSPLHKYAATGVYEVILEVTDGTDAASDVAYATIQEPRGSPPVISTGGPYEGFIHQTIQFQAGASTDPDGDPLTFLWVFGDGHQSSSAAPTHIYARPGSFQAVLRVSDGLFDVTQAAIVTIHGLDSPVAVRVFRAGGDEILPLGALKENLVLQIEPVPGAFDLDDMDLTSILLRCPRSRVVTGIRAVSPAVRSGDLDGNGALEVSATFRTEDLKRLLGHIAETGSVKLTLEGALASGGFYRSELAVRVIPAGTRFEAIVRPNPFNPQTMVTFVTTKPGRVRAHLFDLSGRLVKSVLRDVMMEAGSHNVPVEARADTGASLPSGIYFLRIDGPDGTTLSRLAVTK